MSALPSLLSVVTFLVAVSAGAADYVTSPRIGVCSAEQVQPMLKRLLTLQNQVLPSNANLHIKFKPYIRNPNPLIEVRTANGTIIGKVLQVTDPAPGVIQAVVVDQTGQLHKLQYAEARARAGSLNSPGADRSRVAQVYFGDGWVAMDYVGSSAPAQPTPPVASRPVPGNIYQGGPLPNQFPLPRGLPPASAPRPDPNLTSPRLPSFTILLSGQKAARFGEGIPQRHPYFGRQASASPATRDELLAMFVSSRQLMNDAALPAAEKVRQLGVKFGMMTDSGGYEPPRAPTPAEQQLLESYQASRDQLMEKTTFELNVQREQIQMLLRRRMSGINDGQILDAINKVLNPPPPTPQVMPTAPSHLDFPVRPPSFPIALRYTGTNQPPIAPYSELIPVNPGIPLERPLAPPFIPQLPFPAIPWGSPEMMHPNFQTKQVISFGNAKKPASPSRDAGR